MRVLQIHADNFEKGGISQIIWRFMENLKDKRIYFDFLTYQENFSPDKMKLLKENCCKIVRLKKGKSNFVKGINSRYKQLLAVLSEQNYDIVHVNGDDMMGVMLYVLAAKKSNTKVVVHAHTTKYSTGNRIVICIRHILNLIIRFFIIHKIDAIVACSQKAAIHMYGYKRAKKAVIILNGLDATKYKFNFEQRNIIRDKYGTEEKTIVVGHIGRFTYAKNHEFLVKVFKVLEEQFNCKSNKLELWMIGEGELRDIIFELTRKLNIQSKIRFIEHTSNVMGYLSAMDIMIFPSKYEGLPLVLVEAQASSLPVVCSDVITDEAIYSGFVSKLSLNSSYYEWALKVTEVLEMYSKRQIQNQIVNTELDIGQAIQKLLQVYENI